MQQDNFDKLARDLAGGISRWRALRTFLATIAGSSVLAGAFGARRRANAQGTHRIFLPLIENSGVDICPIASTCDAKHFCSDDDTCRCIKSAEGAIRCGNIPSCDIQHCTSSADCANLGADYFCDTPNSGCCSDGHKQRCIAPCGTPYTCPPQRLCGSTCCPVGTACFNGICVVTGAGTWDGTVSYNGQTSGVRFVIAISSNTMSGNMYLVDPVSKAFIDGGPIDGRLDLTVGDTNWVTLAYQFVEGTFSGNTFSGTITFAGSGEGIDFGFDDFTADMTLTRTASATTTAVASAQRAEVLATY